MEPDDLRLTRNGMHALPAVLLGNISMGRKMPLSLHARRALTPGWRERTPRHTMWILIISLMALGCIAATAGFLHDRGLRGAAGRDEPASGLPGGECCGRHAVCERESLRAATSLSETDYYDDEELDAYIGTPSGNYTPKQEEEFREVFYTMREEDVVGWVRSLQLRGIALPDGLKDEVLLVVGERRAP